MQFDTPSPRKDDEQRILPLINVVFLLLIFFILAGKLSAVDPIAVEPPLSAGGGVLQERDLIVVLGADGTLIMPEVLKSTARLDEVMDRTVWLKADGAADSLDVIAAIEALHEVGVQRLQLVTVPLGEDELR